MDEHTNAYRVRAVDVVNAAARMALVQVTLVKEQQAKARGLAIHEVAEGDPCTCWILLSCSLTPLVYSMWEDGSSVLAGSGPTEASACDSQP